MGGFEELADGHVAVFDEFLLHEAGFFVEFVKTAFGDVFDHLLGEVCSLGSRCFFDDLAGFIGFFFGEPAFCNVGCDVVFGIDEVGVDAGFFEGGFNSLVYLLLFCFLDGDSLFGFYDSSGHFFAANSHGVHGCNLHGYVTTYMEVDVFEVETADSGEFVAEVNVGCGGGSFESLVSADFGFFTGFAAFFDYEVGDCAAIDLESFEFVEGLDTVCDSGVDDLLCEGNETCVFSNEVGFAAEGNDSSECAFVLCHDATFGSLTVGTLCSDGLTFFTEDFDGGVDVAV